MESQSNHSRSEARPKPGDVAVIGMGCLFPGANDLCTYWQNIVERIDCITEAPAELWDQGVYFDANSSQSDRVYCKRGGFLQEHERTFDPIKYGIMPSGIEGSEPDQFLSLRVAYDTLADAGYLEENPHRQRTAVILGRGSYVNAGLMNLVQHGWVIEQTLQILKQLHPEYRVQELTDIKRELVEGLPPLIAEIVPGQVPNIAAGRIANRLDLQGPSYTVDAACASSLIAVDMGIKQLLNGESDLALVGGIQGGNTVLSYIMFCLINALSRQAQIRPFDQAADGTILGEGVGMVALKRQRDAEQDGDRIYALIKGVGTSSDGRAFGLLAPRLEGMELALRRAFEVTGVQPSSLGLLEAHGTATAAGDTTEVSALRRVFGNRDGHLPRCALGSVKSMIGHLLGASGIAGLIKAVLAIHHKVLPPTLNCTQPNPALELDKTPFYVNTETRPWIHGAKDTPRRAGVSSMGFGGINAHAVVEEYLGANASESLSLHRHWDSELIVLQSDSRAGLLQQAQRVRRLLADTPDVDLKDLAASLNGSLASDTCRLAVVATSRHDLEQKLSKAMKRLSDHGCTQIKARSGIYFFEKPLGRESKLAFLFPGEGSQYVNMLADLCIHFPEVRSRFDRMDELFGGHARDRLPSDLIFPRPFFKQEERQADEDGLWKMDGAIEAVLIANDALFELLRHLAIQPDVVVGHSTGEYSAMRAAGILNLIDGPDQGRYLLELNRLHEAIVARGGIPHALLIAVGAHADQVASVLKQIGGELYIAMDNCPHQTVVVGRKEEAKKAVEALNRQGLLFQVLPFDRPYHTILFKAYSDMLVPFYAKWPLRPPAVPIYSCTTEHLFPKNVEDIRSIAVEHWVRPVKFRQTIENMYQDGVRVYVEVGPRGNLTAFVNDILGGRDHIAVATNLTNHSGIHQLQQMLGLLAAQGIPMDLAHLYRRRAPRELVLDGPGEAVGEKPADRLMTLSLQFPRLQVKSVHRSPSEIAGRAVGAQTAHIGSQAVADDIRLDDAALGDRSLPPFSSAVGMEVMAAHFATMERFLEVEHAVMQRFLVDQDLSGIGVALPEDGGQSCPAVGEEPSTASVSAALANPVHETQSKDGPLTDTPLGPVAHFDDGRGTATHSPHTPAALGEISPEALESRLLALVVDKTGYPVEVLDTAMDLEADLGIDSIKRQEILGELLQAVPALSVANLEQVTALKTLKQIIDHLNQASSVLDNPEHIAGNWNSANTPVLKPPEPVPPLIEKVLAFTPARELLAQRVIDPKEDLYLQHHTIGRSVSAINKSFSALPVMPLTMSMELLAEAGALLSPGKVLSGMKDVRAYRWIALEGQSLALRISACRHPGSDEVAAAIFLLNDPGYSQENPVVEATLVFSDVYPQPPETTSLHLDGERPSRWTSGKLYVEGMFHGPLWQGVGSVDLWGRNGSVATLKVLPFDGFLRSMDNPNFITDPVVLDAAGQLVGFWTMEHLTSDALVFPYRLKALHIYGPRRPTASKVKCQARIRLVGAQFVSSHIDLVDAEDKLWMRLEEWEDKRFDLPSRVLRFLLAPVDTVACRVWEDPIAGWKGSAALTCCRLDALFSGNEDFWLRVFARLILDDDERRYFEGIGTSSRRQIQWLMGRLAAKDAIRTLLRREYGMTVGPADIHVEPDAFGRPIVRGSWGKRLVGQPVLSVTHTDGLALALAGHGGGVLQVGIDAEHVDLQTNVLELSTLSVEERAVMQEHVTIPDAHWPLRVWCAREAVGKALGRGLLGRPQDLILRALDPKTGTVRLEVTGVFAREFPQLSGSLLQAQTTRDSETIIASAVHNGGDRHEP